MPSYPCNTDVPPLLLAAKLGHTVMASYLLERGASPWILDNNGETSLH